MLGIYTRSLFTEVMNVMPIGNWFTVMNLPTNTVNHEGGVTPRRTDLSVPLAVLSSYP